MNKVDEKRKLFSEKLKKLVEKSGLSIAAISQIIGIDRGSFYKYLKGQSTPRVDVFLSMCECFEVEPNYFFGINDSKIRVDSDERSAASYIIEALFDLFRMKYIVKIPENHFNSYADPSIRYIVNPMIEQTMARLLSEISLYSESMLAGDLDVCKKLIEKFEGPVNEAILQRLGLEDSITKEE